MLKFIRYSAIACMLASSATISFGQESGTGGAAKSRTQAGQAGAQNDNQAGGQQQSGQRAQQREQAQQQRGGESQQRFSQDRGAARPGQVAAQGNDAVLASMLAIDNVGEIQLSQLGRQRSQNQQVQQFAEMMIKEHTQFIEQLQKHGAQLPAQGQGGESATGARTGAAAGSSETAAGGRAGATTGAADPASARAAAPGGASGATASAGMTLDPVQLKHDIGTQMVENSSRQLSQYEGEKFDKAFVGEQLVLHTHMLSSLQAMQRHASPELQKVLQQGIETTQQHLQHAGQLMASLDEGGQSGNQSQQGTTGARSGAGERKSGSQRSGSSGGAGAGGAGSAGTGGQQ